MESGWLLADGEAVASAQRAHTRAERRRAARSARRGEAAAVLRAPAIVLGPVDLVCVKGSTAASVRAAGRRPVWIVRPGLVVLLGHGDAERSGLQPGTTVELRWTG